MSKEVILWEGVPIEELPREKLLEAVRHLYNEQRYWMEQVIPPVPSSHQQRINRLFGGGKG